MHSLHVADVAARGHGSAKSTAGVGERGSLLQRLSGTQSLSALRVGSETERARNVLQGLLYRYVAISQ